MLLVVGIKRRWGTVRKASRDALRRNNVKLGDIAGVPANALNRIFASLESSEGIDT
jgi:hypothetical protein